MVLDDIIEVVMGVLQPFFPIVFAIALAIILSPWYVGVFWSSAAFKALNIFTILKKVLTPSRFKASWVLPAQAFLTQFCSSLHF